MSISLICACKNRIKPLLISLQSWLLCDEIKEIVIVDWSSDEPIKDITNLDSRIKRVRVNDQQFFNQPQPLNLALKLCTQEDVIKVDSDYVFNPYWNFFESYFVDETSFVCGDVDLEPNNVSVEPYFKYLRGTLYVKRKFLEEVGGWNENMGEYYGGEDGEIENRLELYGLTKKKLKLDYSVMHIPHSNKERVLNFRGYVCNTDLNESIRQNLSYNMSGNELEWNVEYILAERHINTNIQSFYNSTSYYVEPKTKWNIIQLDDQNYVAEML
jgi:glycosyltransferase involved in cell wall biosynthesis